MNLSAIWTVVDLAFDVAERVDRLQALRRARRAARPVGWSHATVDHVESQIASSARAFPSAPAPAPEFDGGDNG